jgi:O-antigen ligase
MQKKNRSFYLNLLIGILLINFVFNALFLGRLGEYSIAGIGVPGILRLLFLSILFFIMGLNLKRFNPVLKYERKSIFIVLLILYLFVQLFFLSNFAYQFQGSIKYYFYFSLMLIGLYNAYVEGALTSNKLVKLAVIFFFMIIVFYPYVIMSSGLSVSERLQHSNLRLGYLLQAGNEDAHVLVSLFPFVLVKLNTKRFFSKVVFLILLVVLFYNGTRSALIMGIFVTALFYFLGTKNKYLFGLISFIVLLILLPFVYNIFVILFKKEFAFFQNIDQFLQGGFTQGNLAGRITYIWVPTVLYTIKNSLMFGFGSNGWQIVASKVTWFSFQGTYYSPHNLFVWIFVSWGLIGLTLFIGFYYSQFLLAYRNYKNSTENLRVITIAVLCSFFAFLAWSFIANAHGAHGWTVLIISVLINISNKYQIKKSKLPKYIS